MPCLSLLLLASLMLHLAVFVAIIAISRREASERHMARYVTVEILEQRIAREGRKEKGTPRRTMALESRRGTPPKPPSLTQSRPVGPMERKQPDMKTRVAEPSPPPGQAPPSRNPSQGTAAIHPDDPAENGSPAMAVGVGNGTGMESGSGGGAGSGPGIGTARSGGTTGRSPGGGPPSTASGASPQRRAAYLAILKGLIEAHKDYPLAARRSRQEGSCLRRFVITRSGALKKVEALSSCGHEYLEHAATRAITAIGAFPPLPEEFGEAEAAFTVTITFTVERK